MTTDAMIIQQPRGVARQLVLLFHGLGASEEDLRPLGERLAAEYPEALVASLRAPHPASLGAGYQWFAVEGLDDARRVERVAAEMPLFVAAIRHWQRDTGLGPEATVLVGFSQGAIMVLEAATQAGDDVLAGRVVALAGRYARLPATNPGATTLFLVHGKADDVVHYGFTVEAARHLVALGADVVADVIPWLGHGIDVKVLDLVARRLRTHVPKRHWEAAMRQLESPPDGVTQ
ncbi:MAG: esterase [Proteobacteria bacterium]|nr:esterase [Pseudomonadota bacterium]